mmetsp:Transcript_3719/g.10675  ORF Transcript_3719/g.10675 Transcript_3719/m.10675 type:complete len:176 (-) Transcript_3719:138-665(-)|eukprot:CAMPEP_0118859172 /NCGR_PEP_ID=MMETSP1163-20130328/5533_1 /TAXON_ID=124430 /ORGANISM="Phaeomonas parva, Strain CCMP2877" /LENGTH=175 /DNA_ID=CAMNT_0006792721 /DNA_START=111 /DNA_END=638 /DNA_ORIENTATION=+
MAGQRLQAPSVFDRRVGFEMARDAGATLYEVLRSWVADCPGQIRLHDPDALPASRFLKYHALVMPKDYPYGADGEVKDGGFSYEWASGDVPLEELRKDHAKRCRCSAGKVTEARVRKYERRTRKALDRLCIPRHAFLEAEARKAKETTAGVRQVSKTKAEPADPEDAPPAKRRRP